MPNVRANGIDIEYEELGDPDGQPLLLIMGLGAQMIVWDDEFCAQLGERGFRVIRFDNRDVGLTTKFEVGRFSFLEAMTKALSGQPVEAPYTLDDMADDAAALLDVLGIGKAHVVGASMGGMIAQTLAIQHPEKVLTLTSIMSTTGEPDVGQPTGEAMAVLMNRPTGSREEIIEFGVLTQRIIGSPDHFDEARARARATATYDRAYYPIGFGRQLVAIVASGTRAERLREVDVPALVIHGTADPLVQPSGGQHTAEMIPGAELLMLEGMGHDLPPDYWPEIIDAIEKLAARA
jgi:pimeloyl-ACP methyl ester carboxylesterase